MTDNLRLIPNIGWVAVLNGNGSTFDAVATIVKVSDETVEIWGALSSVRNGIMLLLMQERASFIDMGYRFMRYRHNKRWYLVDLINGTRKRLYICTGQK